MALQVGDKIPNFSAIDTNGNVFESDTVVGKKSLVIYFYPKDDTRVCTEQACSFRDQYEDFKALGAEVIGVSSDSVKSHQKFAQHYKLPFILLSDSDKKLRKLFGVPNDLLGLIPGRVTYVADKNGVIQLVFNSMSGKIHIEKALEILKRM
ncbi:peroxiredoxin [Flavobacterium sp. J49]|uniref:peroxiredoxin n=1 Tax=Flavobacterium sp. J49 TaxID=2718534 RepID=UPI0015931B0F|nr:peroxiredoxin [Flavobacterium sp. J49]MBF6639951.1 peroxiredoxin [Flavobacterium sp. J49]NIC01196.1 peroxiredoxin [Flavobacterium sp. J49]